MTACAPMHHPTDDHFPSPETIAQLRATLGDFLRGGGTAAQEAAVCEGLTALAAEARERRLHGEQMLLAFKGVWGDLPELAAPHDRVERQRALSHLVSRCIDIYYTR